MFMEEKKISERESLAIINEMIERTKERYVPGDGNIMLMWGYVTVVVSALVWELLVLTHNPAVNWLWFLLWIIGGIATPVMARKESMKKGAKSYTDKVVSGIWSMVGYSAIAATFCCLGFLLICGIDAWSAMLVFALVIVACAEIVNGIVVKEKSLIWGGAIGLLAGIFTLCCISGNVQLVATWYMPIFITAFICMMIIPGHLINHKARRTA